MLGDGDSSTYSTILEANPMERTVYTNKLECIGHVQKRVGSRLRKLKSSNKGRKLSDGKGISGKGRLTTGKMDVLQNYYGFAIRENLDMLKKWLRLQRRLFSNVASTKENPQHYLCPERKEQLDVAIKGIPKHIYNIRMAFQKPIVELVFEPIFADLTDLALLKTVHPSCH